MKLTKQRLKEIIKEELLKESSRMWDDESSQIYSVSVDIDNAQHASALKTLLKHEEPKVKKWIKQLMPLLKKSSKLLDDIYNETMGT